MNHYEVLGVKRTATQAEIKKAYKELVKKYHPDVYKGDPTFAQKKAAQINVAYDVLGNSEARKKYDEETFPSTTYSYTPPKYTSNYYSSYKPYSNTYKNYEAASKNFEKHKQKYSSYTASDFSNVKDGSERDYSTYVNYGGIPNYKRAQNTTNTSQKTYATSQRINKMSHKVILAISISIILYLFVLISSIFKFLDFSNYLNNKNNTITPPSSTNTIENDNDLILDVSEPDVYDSESDYYEEYYNSTNTIESENQIQNSTTNNEYILPVIPDSILSDFKEKYPDIDLSQFFDEADLRSLYNRLQAQLGEENITYEYFIDLIYKYINQISNIQFTE